MVQLHIKHISNTKLIVHLNIEQDYKQQTDKQSVWSLTNSQKHERVKHEHVNVAYNYVTAP